LHFCLYNPRQEIEAFIRAKYVEKRFVLKPTPQEQKEKIMTFRKLDKRIKGNMDFLPPRPPPPTPKLRTASCTSGECWETADQRQNTGWNQWYLSARCFFFLFVCFFWL